MTEKLKTDKETELRTENVQKSDDARSVVKHVGRPRKKRRTLASATAGDIAVWAGETEGNEHMVASDSSTKKIYHKRRGLVEEVESMNYLLPEERNKTMASILL